MAQLYSLPTGERERLQRAFGYSREDCATLLAPMATNGEEPTGSMGNDAALAVLSDKPVSLFRYFKQQFAQVTNPPIDPIREELVMSLVSCVGGEGNLLDETPRQCRLLELPHPILSNAGLAKFLASELPDFRAARVPITFSVRGDAAQVARRGARVDLLARVARGRRRRVDHRADGSRRGRVARADPARCSRRAAVHHHLIREGKRVRCGIVVESGEPREVADMALLVGYGAGAVNPYLAFESIHAMVQDGSIRGVDAASADKNYVKALKKGLLKVLSKMGISTLSSYHGAQIFEAVGIAQSVVDALFHRHAVAHRRHRARRDRARGDARVTRAGSADESDPRELDVGGVYAWRTDGERHLWTPKSIASLQKAVRLEDAKSYEEYARAINDQTAGSCTLRGLLDFRAPKVNADLNRRSRAGEGHRQTLRDRRDVASGASAARRTRTSRSR